MHHPHVPHELKDFGKHLFATFLGLLMAVGLESWHQDHTKKVAAREAHAALMDEIRTNQKAFEKLKRDCEEAVKGHKATLQLFEAMLRDRQQGRKGSGISGEIYVKVCAGTFKTSAWHIALSAQHVSRFSREEAERLSDHYEDLRSLMQSQQQDDFLPGLVHIIQWLESGSTEAFTRGLEAMDTQEIKQTIQSLRLLQARTILRVQELASLQKSAAALLAASGHP